MTDTNGTITVEIDPMKELPNRYLGSDEDGPHYGPMTLYDAIVETAAQKLVTKAEKDIKQAVADRVGEEVARLVEERLPTMVEEALNGEVTITDKWGDPVAKGTLHQQIVKQIQGELTTSGRGSFNDTTLDKVVKEHIGYVLQGELSKAVKEAKDKLVAQVREQASEALAKAVVDGVTKERL